MFRDLGGRKKDLLSESENNLPPEVDHSGDEGPEKHLAYCEQVAIVVNTKT